MYDLCDELEEVMREHDYTWRIDDVLQHPSAADIKQVIDKAVAELYYEQDGALIEVGRLIIQKNGTMYDVYLHFGAIK